MCMYVCIYYNLFKALFPWMNTQSFLTVALSGLLSNEIPDTE